MENNPIYPDLKGKVALVTGGSSGIGLDTAKKYLAQGTKIAILALNDALLVKAEEELKALGGEENVFTVGCNLTKEVDVISAFEKTIAHYGEIHYVLNNAGISNNAPFEDTTIENWQRVLDLNLTGAFLVAREAFRVFKKLGKGGVIIFINSDNSLKPSKQSVAYNVSKAGALHLARCVADEGGKYQIRSHSILPGAVFGSSSMWTDEYRRERAAVHGYDPDKLEFEYKKANSLGVIIDPKEIAELVLFLSSQVCSKVTGSALVIDGGNVGSYVR